MIKGASVRSLLRVALILILLAVGLGPLGSAEAASLPVPGPCLQGTLSGGALSLICVPVAGWNGDVVVYAHGYVAPNEPLGFYNLTLADGTYLPDLVQGLGYAFATTSYRENGLAILPGLEDISQLIVAFPSTAGKAPVHTYLVGVSEGGLVTTLEVERSPQLVSGGLAACGPIGSFQRQIDYFGDFRVLFDYFFPGLLPPSPIAIPSFLMSGWGSIYQPEVTSSVEAEPAAAAQLISTSNAAIDRTSPSTSSASTASDLLWYNVFATNDARAKLGGNPYGNEQRIYRGSANDGLLNQQVGRFRADPVALANVVPYETSGNLTLPLVTIHTTGDDVIPFWQEALYRAKAHPSGNGSLTQLPVDAYGHCNFTESQLLSAFTILVQQVTHS